MRKLLTVGLVSASLVLVQCTTTQVQQVETFIGQVQRATAQICKFVPEVATIITFVNSGIGMAVGAISTAICNAVPPPTSARFKAISRLGSGLPPSIVAPGVSGWRVQ